MKNIKAVLVFFITFSLVGCNKDLLDVTYDNNPGFEQVFAGGEDVENLAAGLFNTWFHGNHHQNGGFHPILATAADLVTCSHGNFGMNDSSTEPRNSSWNNSPTYTDAAATEWTFDYMYSAISSANNIINAIEGGTDLGPEGANNARAIAVARFIQGIAHASLAFYFDKGFVVGENAELEEDLNLAVPYKDMRDAALGFLDQAIQLGSSNDFTIPADWLGTPAPVSSADFVKIANTYAARALSYTPRNQNDLNEVDWNRVKNYADNGIDSDFIIQLDGGTIWHVTMTYYITSANGWGQTDMYVVHMMDPENQPQIWENRPDFPHPPASGDPLDKRLLSDFTFVPSNTFRPERGYYHFSNYRYTRYIPLFSENWPGDGPYSEVRLTENDMLRAEARAYLGELNEAAAIINAGTRTTRGEMPNVGADLDELIQAIHHERFVECYVTGLGLQFMEMRKLDLLQTGTPLHYPIPGSTLELFGESAPFYTFGTVARADGIGTSNGGWK